MKNLTAVIGTVGSGKSRLLLKKIQELSNQYEYVFAVNLEYNRQDVPQFGDALVVLFDTIDEMLAHLKEHKINSANVALVVDNGVITLTPESVAEIKKLNFAKTIVSLQVRRNANLSAETIEESKVSISTKWGIEDDYDIEVIPVV